MRCAELAAVVFAVATCSVARGADVVSMLPFTEDFSVQTGAAVGTVQVDGINDDKPAPFGAGTVGVGFNKDLSYKWATFAELQVGADLSNMEVVRQGGGLAIAWHIMGGQRRLVETLPTGIVVQRSVRNISMLMRSGYNQYSAKPATVGAKELKGATLEISPGFEARFDMGETAALGFRVYKSVIAFPVGAEKIAADMAEALMFVRIQR